MKTTDATQANPHSELSQRLWELVEPVCEGVGYELVDLRLVQSPSGWVLRVFIDFADGDETGPERRIGFSDCEVVSRDLGAVLDVEDPIPQAFSLEVSSPGLDRPLRTEAHFAKHLGHRAKISLVRPVGERRRFTGEIVRITGGAVVIEADGAEHALPLADIESAQLIPDWDALLSKSSRQGGQARKRARP